MSRIIVKNLPKLFTAKKLETLFSSQGVITDLQLKYNKEGVFRQFAFIGFKTDEEAQAAKEYFHNTFVNTSSIQVEICSNLGDPNKPKPRKRDKDPPPVAKSKKDKVDEQESKTKKKGKEISEELLKDAKFKEFLEVNKKRESKPVWAEEIIVSDESGAEEDASSSDGDYEENYEKAVKDDTEQCKESSASVTKKKKDSKKEKKKAKEEDKTSLKEKYDDSFTIKIRNLPYKCKKKNIKQFLKPLKIVSLRIPPKKKGFAYVKFKSEKDLKLALTKNKSYMDGTRVDIVKYTKKDDKIRKENNCKQSENDGEKNEELLAETGRIYVRNLCFSVTESEIEEVFKKYGPLAEVHLPIDRFTKKPQGIAFVSFVFAEHAVKAFSELDGTVFQGRLLHLIPAKPKKEYQNEDETNFKKKKESELKELSNSSHNWNILFLGMNAIADVISEKYNVEKSKLLSGDSKESLGVRMALAETEMVMENRNFLVQNGVQLDAFSQADAQRSKTVIVVKNLPAKADSAELEETFGRHGSVARVVMPPSKMVALVEYMHPTEAKTAFKKLAYSRFHERPLYLEWAPMDGLKPALKEDVAQSDEKDENKPEEGVSQAGVSSEESSGTTIFVSNINFDTTQEDFRKHFESCGPIEDATISTKADIKTGNILSMGFGFVKFKNRESAVSAIQNLQHSKLDDYALELKFAKRDTKKETINKRKKQEVKKQLSAKILVRNIPFEAAEREIRELFSKFGMLKSVRLPMKLDASNEHRGFGFVEYFTKDSAERAFNALCHSTHLYGRRMVLEWANPDSENVDDLRLRAAKEQGTNEQRTKLRKRKLNEDVAMASVKYGTED